MEEFKTVATLVANLGGMGALAWALLVLHRESIKAFREELGAEREICAHSITTLRGERIADHKELSCKLDGVQDSLHTIGHTLEEVRKLCE